MEPIRLLSDSFNKGEAKAAAATLSSHGVTIIDEISPHVWQGPHAFDMYLRAYAAFEQAQGITDEVYKPGKPTRVVASGGDGYVALPVTYTFNQKGVPMRAAARMVYVLQKDVGGWRITSFTWVGAAAKPATGAERCKASCRRHRGRTAFSGSQYRTLAKASLGSMALESSLSVVPHKYDLT
jgi:hypothetical protein